MVVVHGEESFYGNQFDRRQFGGVFVAAYREEFDRGVVGPGLADHRGREPSREGDAEGVEHLRSGLPGPFGGAAADLYQIPLRVGVVRCREQPDGALQQFGLSVAQNGRVLRGIEALARVRLGGESENAVVGPGCRQPQSEGVPFVSASHVGEILGIVVEGDALRRVEVAGNLLSAFSHLTGAKKNDDGYYELFGTEYAQYVKLDFDFSKGIVLDSRNKLAFHIGVGVGMAYGNSNYLPFERAYFSGGANSVRGWSVRELGPGSMEVDSTTSFALQSGDIRLDLNLEYRTKLFWKFELAAYIDAGNIWTRNVSDERYKAGNFDFSRFYKEIAVSYGLGLRLDFDFFLLRLDTGFKAYNPQEKKSRRWAITRPNFKDNFALHFAVGYPF